MGVVSAVVKAAGAAVGKAVAGAASETAAAVLPAVAATRLILPHAKQAGPPLTQPQVRPNSSQNK